MNDTDTVIPSGHTMLEQSEAAVPSGETVTAHEVGLRDVPAGPGTEAQGAVRPQRTVPYGALAEERARRKELQRELQSSMDAQQRLQERLDLLHQLAQQQTAPDTEPNPEAALEAAEPQQEMPSEPPAIAEADGHAEADFRTHVMQSVRDVMRERPDFLAAYEHARQARVSELCALGYTPQEALEITFDNELEVIQNAYANGRNPAEVIYDYAQRRGYGGAVSSGAPAVRANLGAMSEAERVALAARGQAASKSLSTAGGGSTGALTLEALASMSDEEFTEATKGDRWHKLLKN